MVIFDCILARTCFKTKVHYLQCYTVLILHKCSRSKSSLQPLRAQTQKQMLVVTKPNYPKITFVKSRIEKGEEDLNVKTAFHMSSKHNNPIDRTQNTTEEDGRQATREGRKRTRLYTKLPKFCR